MTKLFISHSIEDSNLHDAVKEFLTIGFGFPPDDIFSTSSARSLSTGGAYVQQIQSALQQCTLFLALMTPAYFRSPFSLAELGGVWFGKKKIIPLLTDSVTVELYNKTPLLGMQFRRLTERDLTALYDELCDQQILEKRDTNRFCRQRNIFLANLRTGPEIAAL